MSFIVLRFYWPGGALLVHTGFIWQKTGSDGRVLRTVQRTFWVPVKERQLASQKQFYFMNVLTG